jgi:anti-sigma factor RsiW
MPFLSPRKTKDIHKGEFIMPSLLVWEDTNQLRVVSADYPLPVSVVSGGSGGGSSVPTTIISGRKTIATAGVRETLVASSTPAKQIVITALNSNTGEIWVGDNTVSGGDGSQKGNPLFAGESVVLEIDDAQKVYLDATVNGEGVTFNILN